MSDILYFSRLMLSPRSRQARAEIANPYELHRVPTGRILHQFPATLSVRLRHGSWNAATR